MNKLRNRFPVLPPRASGGRLVAETGNHCPLSGTWATRVGEREVVVWLSEGQLMPPASGLPSSWTYLPESRSSIEPALASVPVPPDAIY